jgi:hypothetical protein
MVEIVELSEMPQTKKRKIPKNLIDDGKAVVKKKKKIVKDAMDVEATSEMKENREKVKSKKSKATKPVDGEKKLKKKSDKSLKPSTDISAKKKDVIKSKEGKTMDYKQYHLKKLKEKKNKAKRIRQKKGEKKEELKEKVKEPKKSKERKSERQAKQFGLCDFAEFEHYWNEFASSSLTAVEREELQLNPKNVIVNEKGRAPDKFLAKNIPEWSEWSKKEIPNGSPQIIVLCPSALRATDLNRTLAPFTNCRPIKLIAKEKAKVQAENLTKNVTRFAIGTPHRVDLLLSHDNLKLDELRVIALDWSFEDLKKLRLITIQDIRKGVFELFRKFILPLMKTRNDISLVMF